MGKMQKSLLLIGGKGGVGKTICSAAIAVRLATVNCRTLLIISDLTPSLSDILEQNIGDKIIRCKKISMPERSSRHPSQLIGRNGMARISTLSSLFLFI
jgi:CO dehydrogenase nickel-insertion accessory protein CooC1